MKKNILIIDDSALMRRIFCDIINSDSRFEVKATANDGKEGLKILEKESFDAIILDINMPNMNGIEFLKALKRAGRQEKIVVASTYTKAGAAITLTCLELGAMDFIQKPLITRDVKGEEFVSRFLQILDVVTSLKPTEHKTVASEMSSTATLPSRSTCGIRKLVAICSSTGGPQALKSVIPYLPANIDAPIIVVQHMPSGFTKSLAERLDSLSQVSVSEAQEGDRLENGHVYIAKGGAHLKYSNSCTEGRLVYTDEAPREGVRPCANYLYESLIDSPYDEIVCVVLTGMGKDGSEGIVNLSKSKKLYVVSQNESSCTVYGMPKAVNATGITDKVVDLSHVAQEIIMNVGVK